MVNPLIICNTPPTGPEFSLGGLEHSALAACRDNEENEENDV